MPIATSMGARDTTRMLMDSGQPPDSFQANAGWDLLSWVVYNEVNDNASRLAVIDPVKQGWRDWMPPEVLQTVSLNNNYYGVPLDIHRTNTLFYNTALLPSFADNPPTSLDELFAAAAALQANGMAAPIALGAGDDMLSLLFFENLLVARAKADFYQKFMRGEGDPFAPEIATALDDLSTLLTYANKNAAGLLWSEAASRVLTGDAALMIMGDWAKAFMMNVGATFPGGPPGQPGQITFGAIPTPGTKGTFVFTTDTFGLPLGAPNEQGTIDMLTAFGSQTGQDIFNPLKGSISPRTDSDRKKYDAMAQQTIDDFQASQKVAATAILAPPGFMDQMNTALLAFIKDGNKSNVIHTIANYYDMLVNSALSPLL
jgi:glucose/mannose transport system substrate-binding protein